MYDKIGFILFLNLLLWVYRPCMIGELKRRENLELTFLEKYAKYEKEIGSYIIWVTATNIFFIYAIGLF